MCLRRRDAAGVASGVYAAGTGSTAKGNLDGYYTTAFPTGLAAPVSQQTAYAQQTGTLAAGTLGFAWHEVIVARRGSTVDWSIDGIRIATLTNATPTASNVFVGYWDMFASLTDNTNLSFGLVDNVRVEVPVVAPAITAQPQGQTVLQGSNAAFSVTASGTAPFSYQWRFNGTNLASASASVYTVTNAQPANAGSYTVVLANSAGSITSAVAQVVVTNPPPPLPGHFNSICRSADGSLQFTMSGTAGGSYVVEWTSDFLGWTNLCTYPTPMVCSCGLIPAPPTADRAFIACAWGRDRFRDPPKRFTARRRARMLTGL